MIISSVHEWRVKLDNTVQYYTEVPIPVAARSKTWVCDLSFVGIAVSNPSGSMDVCVL
jgi:hypothetical protein